jgi:hypothetical protein
LPVNTTATEVYHNNLKTHDPKRFAKLAARPQGPDMIYGPAILFDRRVWY